MKKLILALVVTFVFAGIFIAWLTFGSATAFSSSQKYLYLYDNRPVKEQTQQQLSDSNYIHNVWWFNILANRFDVWQRLKGGRFEIKRGESMLAIIKTLRNNRQAPARLVINKLRTANDFAKLIGKNFSTDSVQALSYFTNNDSLKPLGVDTNTLLTLVIPDTYILYWNTSLPTIMRRLEDEKNKFWEENNRTEMATAMGFTPVQIVTLASIVEEETNKSDEKGNIASVYINRYRKGQALGADPTIKFALKNFGLKRILYGHLNVVSPYNTYKNKGLPPGPICTPSVKTIDAVLHAPQTDYFFFVARSDFNGYHHFSSNFAEHQQYAKLYQHALDSLIKSRQTGARE
ncbi:MAG: endolytic transglycosylase MltG [Bacteroidota bacterium]|nr:endolytic transglycosylase MltG [Bacteroidota bacterium]